MKSITRRRFLQHSASAAGLAAAVAGKSVAAAALAADDYFGGWPIGVQSYSLRKFGLIEAVRHLQGMGIKYAEFFKNHLDVAATADVIQSTKTILSEAGITLNAHGVNGFTADHAANEKIFKFAKQAGIRNLTANPEPDSFDSLDKLVAQYDVRIAIHNHGPGALFDKIADVTKAVKGHDPRIGACVDTGHFIRSNEDPVQAVRELKGRVFAVHLKDDQYKGDKRSHNVVIGKANLDVVGMFRAMKEIGFPADGAISLEYESNPDNPIDDMKQCLAVVREAIAKLA